MKKIYYFIATAIVACAIFIGTISNGRASSIVDELQKSNLDLLNYADAPVVLITKCLPYGPDSKDDEDPIYHKCAGIGLYTFNDIKLECKIAHAPKNLLPRPLPEDCYLIIRE